MDAILFLSELEERANKNKKMEEEKFDSKSFKPQFVKTKDKNKIDETTKKLELLSFNDE